MGQMAPITRGLQGPGNPARGGQAFADTSYPGPGPFTAHKEVGIWGAHLSSLHLAVITILWLAAVQTTPWMGIWVWAEKGLTCCSGAPLPTTGAWGKKGVGTDSGF